MPRCPVCRTRTDLIKYENVPIHNCGTCGGHWLTDLKLDAILARRDVDMPAVVKEKFVQLADASNSPHELLCIGCGCVMVKEHFKYWGSIQLDRCPKCKGLWVDRGELEKCQIFWERMQDEPHATDAQRAERLGKIEAELAERQAQRRDVVDRAQVRLHPISRVLTDLFVGTP